MKYLITASLLNSALYYMKYKGDNEDSVKQSFLDTLNRIKTLTTETMQAGIDFENHVKLAIEGKKGFIFGKDQQYADCVSEIADIVQGGAWQAKVYKDITIDNIDFFLYGKVDVLKGAFAYDIKFTGNYEVGKYFDSAQHPMYLECLGIPEFEYLVSDGRNVWREPYSIYTGIKSITTFISNFIEWLPEDWKKIYFEKWESKENQ